MQNKLKINDMITIGVYTAIYFLLTGVATFLSSILIPGFSIILLPGFVAFITGAVYFLLIQKVPKFGAVSIMGIVMGLFFLLVGHFSLTFVPHFVAGFLADWVARIGHYKNKRINQISFVIFSFNMMGPILPLWFFKKAYVNNLVARGKDARYIADTFAFINQQTLFISLGFLIICGIIGAIIGDKMIQKHFAALS